MTAAIRIRKIQTHHQIVQIAPTIAVRHRRRHRIPGQVQIAIQSRRIRIENRGLFFLL